MIKFINLTADTVKVTSLLTLWSPEKNLPSVILQLYP